MRSKVTVVGAGNVGATLGQRVAERDYADVVLVDVIPNMPQGKALDILEAGPALGYDSLVTGTNGYDETAGSDVVVITSGIARKPGMSRDDSSRPTRTSSPRSRKRSPPLAQRHPHLRHQSARRHGQLAFKVSGFPKQRIIGQAGVLDTARFRTFIAQELGVSVRDVQARAWRPRRHHGAASRLSTVGGVPVSELIPPAGSKRSCSARATAARRSSSYWAPAAPTTPPPPRRSR